MIAALELLCPRVTRHLPKRKKLSGPVLESYAAEVNEKSNAALKQKQQYTGGRVNLLSDVWQNSARVHLLGCQLSLFSTVLTVSLDELGSRHDGVAIAKQMDQIIEKAFADKWNIGAIVTDNAGQCRILALRWPRLAFLFCFAHDVNNLVKAVLKIVFKDLASKAVGIVKALIASSSKWLPRAQELLEMFYGYKLALFALCETRWNSMQACFASLLRVKHALTVFAEKYEDDPEFPPALKQLDGSTFWRDLRDAESVISPLSAASYLLQRDENTLSDVVKSFGRIYNAFAKNQKYGCQLVPCVETVGKLRAASLSTHVLPPPATQWLLGGTRRRGWR